MEMTISTAILGALVILLFHPKETLAFSTFLLAAYAIFISLPEDYLLWSIFFVFSLFAAKGAMKMWEELG